MRSRTVLIMMIALACVSLLAPYSHAQTELIGLFTIEAGSSFNQIGVGAANTLLGGTDGGLLTGQYQPDPPPTTPTRSMLMPLPPLVTVIAEGSAASPPGIQTPATGPSPEASAFFLSLDPPLLPQGREVEAGPAGPLTLSVLASLTVRHCPPGQGASRSLRERNRRDASLDS